MLQMMCEMWNLKKFRSAGIDKMRILIAQTQIANAAHAKLDVKFQIRKEKQESSQMRLLNVMFIDDPPPRGCYNEQRKNEGGT